MKMANNEKEKKIGFFRKVVRNLYPSYMYENVESIPYELIEKNDIKLIILDMDNTLIDNKNKYTKELENWAKEMKKKNVILYILSNTAFGKKIEKVAQGLNMKYRYNASKPSLKGFKKIVEETKIDKKNILMIGDQLFTDIWGGNRFGIKTVLVSPIAKDEAFISKVKRPLERIVLKHYLKAKGGD